VKKNGHHRITMAVLYVVIFHHTTIIPNISWQLQQQAWKSVDNGCHLCVCRSARTPHGHVAVYLGNNVLNDKRPVRGSNIRKVGNAGKGKSWSPRRTTTCQTTNHTGYARGCFAGVNASPPFPRQRGKSRSTPENRHTTLNIEGHQRMFIRITNVNGRIIQQNRTTVRTTVQ